MAVGGHAIIKIIGKTELTPKKLVNTAVNDAKLTKKDEYGGKRIYAVVIEESHVIAHKFGDYWILDVYTCGNKEQMESALESLISKFEVSKIFSFYTPRGIEFSEKDFEEKPKVLSKVEPIKHGYDHLLLDLKVDRRKIERVDTIVNYVKEVVNGDVIARYQFAPYGASGIIGNGKYLVTFHSWPEHNLLTIDFIGFKKNLNKVEEFVSKIDGKVLSEWNLSY